VTNGPLGTWFDNGSFADHSCICGWAIMTNRGADDLASSESERFDSGSWGQWEEASCRTGVLLKNRLLYQCTWTGAQYKMPGRRIIFCGFRPWWIADSRVGRG
jgi:hypothetical protein